MSELVFTLSAPHRKVIKILESWGIQLMEEVPFPPYQVDIYIPDVHVAIEVDGPHHSKKANEKRDKKLLEEYLLPTFRIKANDVRATGLWKPDLLAFLEGHTETATERWEKCSPRTPWL